MGFLGEFFGEILNESAGWTSQDISVTEMAEMIETSIIQGAGTIDLMHLEDAMEKSWILMVGNGGTTRRYSFRDDRYRIIVEYSSWTRKMKSVKLWDMENKINYSIPEERELLKTLCNSVLARLSRYKKQ